MAVTRIGFLLDDFQPYSVGTNLPDITPYTVAG
jgi:hypothetical protein